jgi:hypothetical protein
LAEMLRQVDLHREVPALRCPALRVIPNCGDIDSSAPPSAPEQAAHIPLDYRTFLQWMSQWRRT